MTAQEVYAGHERGVLLSDALGIEECEVEDILGDDVILPFLDRMIGSVLTIGNSDRMSGSLPVQIESAATRAGVNLPPGWRGEVARQVAGRMVEPQPARRSDRGAGTRRAFVQGVSQRFQALNA